MRWAAVLGSSKTLHGSLPVLQTVPYVGMQHGRIAAACSRAGVCLCDFWRAVAGLDSPGDEKRGSACLASDSLCPPLELLGSGCDEAETSGTCHCAWCWPSTSWLPASSTLLAGMPCWPALLHDSKFGAGSLLGLRQTQYNRGLRGTSVTELFAASCLCHVGLEKN